VICTATSVVYLSLLSSFKRVNAGARERAPGHQR